MFTPRDRDLVRERVISLAAADTRLVAGAVVGSTAAGGGDRWSDLDLTFAVADHVSLAEVLATWTETMVREFAAVKLFDLWRSSTVYRVFLLPGCLQLDLSFTPASEFGAIGPKFRLLFGSAVEKPWVQPRSADDLFGYAVHHAVRARICIERGRYWQAEYWISAMRDDALALACLRRGLPAHEGRGFDNLPADVQHPFHRALMGSIDPDELLRALEATISALFGEAGDLSSAAPIESELLRLTNTPLGND